MHVTPQKPFCCRSREYVSWMALKPIQWVFYISEMGRPVVRIEIEKMRLSADEMKKLETTLARISTGMSTWHDSDYLGSEIWEVRVRLQHKQIRVLYSVENTPVMNLALLAAIKKVQKTPHHWITTALKRRKDWLRRVNSTN